jgi:hypothetical protein
VIQLQHTIIMLITESNSAASLILPSLPTIFSTSEDIRRGVVSTLQAQYQRMAQARLLLASTSFLGSSDLDSIIERLLAVRGKRPGNLVTLPENEIHYLCSKSREIFISQPILLELEAPVTVSSYISVITVKY